MYVHTAVRFTRDGGSDHIHQAQGRGAALFAFAHGRQGVGGFAGLADGEKQGVVVDYRGAVAELGGILDLYRDAGQLLDHVFADHGGMP